MYIQQGQEESLNSYRCRTRTIVTSTLSLAARSPIRGLRWHSPQPHSDSNTVHLSRICVSLSLSLGFEAPCQRRLLAHYPPDLWAEPEFGVRYSDISEAAGRVGSLARGVEPYSACKTVWKSFGNESETRFEQTALRGKLSPICRMACWLFLEDNSKFQHEVQKENESSLPFSSIFLSPCSISVFSIHFPTSKLMIRTAPRTGNEAGKFRRSLTPSIRRDGMKMTSLVVVVFRGRKRDETSAQRVSEPFKGL